MYPAKSFNFFHGSFSSSDSSFCSVVGFVSTSVFSSAKQISDQASILKTKVLLRQCWQYKNNKSLELTQNLQLDM